MALGDFDSSQTSVQYGESLLAAKQEADRKRRRSARRDRKWQYGIAAINVADQFMARKAQKQIEDLNESMRADLIIRKSDFRDKEKFEELYDKIKGDAFNPDDEESYAQYFYNKALEDYNNANKRETIHKNKDLWIDAKTDGYIYDWKNSLKNWKPQLRATEEEFTLPITQYYADQVKEVLSPSNVSSVRKLLEKVGLMNKKEIQSSFNIGQYTGALANTKTAKEAYDLAMKNTNVRLERLREGITNPEGRRPDTPLLEARIITSKDVDRELKKQIDFAVNVDTSGVFYFENMPLTGNPKAVSMQDRARHELLGPLKSTDPDDPDKQGSIFAKVFRSHAQELGWTDPQFEKWLIENNGKGGKTFQALLVHPFTGPTAARDLTEVVLPLDMGGVYPSIGAVEYFQEVWARNAQDIYDYEKQFERGLKLTEGADPAIWEEYMMEGFKMTIENNLKLLDNGKLLIVPNNNEITMIERLGPKINQAGETTETPGETPETEIPESIAVKKYNIPEDASDEDKAAINQIIENGVIETFQTEIPEAYKKGKLEGIKGIRDKFIQLFPEDADEIKSEYNSFMESILNDREQEDLIKAENDESGLGLTSRQMYSQAQKDTKGGIETFGSWLSSTWNKEQQKIDKENVKKLLELDSLQPYQANNLNRALKRLDIDINLSKEDIFSRLQDMETLETLEDEDTTLTARN